VRLDETARRATQAQRREIGKLHRHGIIACVTDAEIFATAAVLAGGACHSATGFGFVLVVGPLVAAALPPEQAITSLLCLGMLTSGLTLLTEFRRPVPLWRESAEIFAWGTGGAFAGTWVLARLDTTALQLSLTAMVIATLLVRRLARTGSDPFLALPVVGLSAGALTTTTSTNGPPILLYLLGRGVPAHQLRDTLSVLFIAFAAIGLVALGVGETDAVLPDAAVVGAFAGAATVGHVSGRPLFAHLAERQYDRVVTVLLIVSVIAGAVVALA
jgi:hypothetical protein